VVILSSPSDLPACVEGKVEWLHRFTRNPRYKDFMLGRRKYLCAAPGRILVDDSQHNIDAFRKAGGEGIVFPQPWNSLRSVWETGKAKDYVLMNLLGRCPSS